MAGEVRVAILEDHESIIDGYRYRLRNTKDVHVVATANYAIDLEPMLQKHAIDILLMDVQLPVSPENPNPYPILQIIPKLRQEFPTLSVLVISAHDRPELVNAVINAGARGYIYKNDFGSIQNLGHIILAVAKGVHFMSKSSATCTSETQTNIPDLTPRQLEILSTFASEPDLTTMMVAQQLNISHSTVRNLLSKAYERLGVKNLTAAIRKMRELGIFVYPDTLFDAPQFNENTPPSS